MIIILCHFIALEQTKLACFMPCEVNQIFNIHFKKTMHINGTTT